MTAITSPTTSAAAPTAIQITGTATFPEDLHTYADFAERTTKGHHFAIIGLESRLHIDSAWCGARTSVPAGGTRRPR